MKKKTNLLQIAQLGHIILRKKTIPVTDITHPEIQQLIDNMIATVIDVHGVGIAAPQVYQPVQLFIIASRPNPRYPDAPHMKPFAMINPQLLSPATRPLNPPAEGKVIKDWEGCLSIPGIRGLVPRYESITVSYTSRTGALKKKILRGFPARIFQHEFDHIHGKVFLDRLETNTDIISDKEYQKIIMIETTKKSADK